jgi:hypothetical protein
MVHLFIHVLALVPPWLYFAGRYGSRQKVALLLGAGFLVDADHLLADPVYDPLRCSIGFHPLHTDLALTVMAAGLLFRPTRIVSAGLLIHMLVDAMDCLV